MRSNVIQTYFCAFFYTFRYISVLHPLKLQKEQIVIYIFSNSFPGNTSTKPPAQLKLRFHWILQMCNILDTVCDFSADCSTGAFRFGLLLSACTHIPNTKNLQLRKDTLDTGQTVILFYLVTSANIPMGTGENYDDRKEAATWNSKLSFI